MLHVVLDAFLLQVSASISRQHLKHLRNLGPLRKDTIASIDQERLVKVRKTYQRQYLAHPILAIQAAVQIFRAFRFLPQLPV